MVNTVNCTANIGGPLLFLTRQATTPGGLKWFIHVNTTRVHYAKTANVSINFSARYVINPQLQILQQRCLGCSEPLQKVRLLQQSVSSSNHQCQISVYTCRSYSCAALAPLSLVRLQQQTVGASHAEFVRGDALCLCLLVHH